MATLVGGQIGTEGFFGMRAGTVPLNDPSMIAGYEQYKQPFDRELASNSSYVAKARC